MKVDFPEARREAVVAIARTWRDTPFHHEARIKGIGVDCLQFVVAVYQEAGLLDDIEIEHYPHDWHFHRDEERYLVGFAQHARSVTTPLPGDVALYKFGRCVSHAALVIEWPLCIHAYMGQGVVEVDGENSAELAGRLHSFWSRIE